MPSVRHAAAAGGGATGAPPEGEGKPGAFAVPAAVRRDPVSNYKPLRSFVPGYCRIRVG
ncbi:hypothetical protein Mro03_41920 [Microbispora rosea subsp. rosea]|nr:hypothetical protein Mro03_41920 [Microbispora rosea subsp. rosea]